MTRRAQMEILGLAIVFVLIVLGFLLYVRFAPSFTDDTRDEFTQPVKAQSILTAMLRTHIPCTADQSYSVIELFKDGFDPTLGEIECEFGSDYYDSEDMAFKAMDDMLLDTMVAWNEPYWYEVEVDDVIYPVSYSLDRPCNSNSPQHEPGFHAVELRTTTLEIRFGICN
ncbi:hypothetical protein N9934_01095 [Desulfosarcina sp.]|nr:hypothetical protein [Desulfosarcina sp.]